MKSDNSKRHKETHKDLLSLPDNEIKDELKSRQEFKKNKKKIYKKLWKLQKRMTKQFQKKLSAKSANLLRKSTMFVQNAYKDNKFTYKRWNWENKTQML